MIHEKRRKAFLTKRSKLVRFTKKGVMNLGVSEEEFDRLVEMGFIKTQSTTICTECFREIEEDDCPFCGYEEAAITTNNDYMYNEDYEGRMPPFE